MHKKNNAERLVAHSSPQAGSSTSQAAAVGRLRACFGLYYCCTHDATAELDALAVCRVKWLVDLVDFT